MIRPLRKRHRIMWIALAVLLPAGLAVALLERRPPAVQAELPAALVPAADEFPHELARGERSYLGLGLEVRLLGSEPEGGALAVEVRPTGELQQKPDPLLYWTDGELAELGRAHLLGPLGGEAGRVYPLRPGTARGQGRLFVHSPALGATLFDIALPPSVDEETP